MESESATGTSQQPMPNLHEVLLRLGLRTVEQLVHERERRGVLGEAGIPKSGEDFERAG